MENHKTNRDIAKNHKIMDKGLDARLAYNMIKDQLILDGNAKQNLATFVTTYIFQLPISHFHRHIKSKSNIS